ncbi:MAG: HAMP domain-containing histidine kinase [Bacteroidales bacterium]|nr:HAMP domain-containing histidine kinase [Bacteroidales bacterium]MCF8455673.1 HAMP domain-containing histidine kinase [Bacteroidales bacterium]
MKNKYFNKLFWNISAIFIITLVIFASITVYISVRSARNYAIEVNQKLNHLLAKNTVDVIKPDFSNGQVHQEALNDIMHSMMVINPSVEVYLLDPEGKILSYVAPEKVVKLKEVSLVPIHQFLSNPGDKIIFGDDPRNPGEKKIFSAAEVIESGQLTGYVYIVLASQEYVSTSQMVIGSYILNISIRSIITILLISAILGLVAIWYITKKLNLIIKGIKEFRAGEHSSRITVKSDSELDSIGLAFNEMADEIEKNIKELKGIDELRKELISNISHDLRTPVASIQGYAETLILKAGNINNEEQKKYLEIIYNSCERLKVQVNELFELSKLQTNQVELKPEAFSIAELVSDVANKYRILSQKRGISINTFISKDTPAVIADISLIDRVLQNLIDNAVKFCRENDFINIELETSDPDKVKISIADTGMGISQEELPSIFERYYKGKSYQESTGLGLAIVKKIMDLHETEIKVKSQPGVGTTFTFELPVAKTA